MKATPIMISLLAFASLVGIPQQVWSQETLSSDNATNWRNSIENFSKENFKHPAWGYGHSKRIYADAKRLAKIDNVQVDDDVLFAAAMLHDIAAFPKWASADKDHADQAIELLPAILLERGFPKSKIPGVLESVRTHFFDRKPVSAEAIYIHDADALDWLGAVGAFRLIAIVETGETPPDAKMAMGMLEQRLKMVPTGVVSRAGKRETSIRKRSLQKFIDELRAQSKSFEDL